MSQGFQSGGSPDRPSREVEQPRDPRDSVSNKELLDQILQTTLSLGRGGNDPLSPEELRTLTAVAKRRGGEPLSVETAMELVQVVLRLRFRSLADSRDQWERMTRQIAETIFDDPQSNDRLRSLWTLLCEAAK